MWVPSAFHGLDIAGIESSMHGSPVYLYDTALQYSSESPADFATAFLAGF